MRFRSHIAPIAVTVLALLSAPSLLRASPPCNFAPLLNQQRDVATIQRLERQWDIAYITGDTTLERCILTADFTQIMSNGEVKGLTDEIGFAAKNIGRNLPMPDTKPGAVFMHGNVAVAYGMSSASKASDPQATRYADYYIWESGQWHAYFAQQTRFSVVKPVANVTLSRPIVVAVAYTPRPRTIWRLQRSAEVTKAEE